QGDPEHAREARARARAEEVIGLAQLAQHTPALAWTLVVGGLGLAYAWIGWIAFLRFRELRGRDKMRERQAAAIEKLGASGGDDGEGFSDAQEALREDMVRHGRGFDRRRAANS